MFCRSGCLRHYLYTVGKDTTSRYIAVFVIRLVGVGYDYAALCGGVYEPKSAILDSIGYDHSDMPDTLAVASAGKEDQVAFPYVMAGDTRIRVVLLGARTRQVYRKVFKHIDHKTRTVEPSRGRTSVTVWST